jgi:hypothetical protein
MQLKTVESQSHLKPALRHHWLGQPCCTSADPHANHRHQGACSAALGGTRSADECADSTNLVVGSKTMAARHP